MKLRQKLFLFYLVGLIALVWLSAWVQEFKADQCEDAGGTAIRSIVGIYSECVPAN